MYVCVVRSLTRRSRFRFILKYHIGVLFISSGTSPFNIGDERTVIFYNPDSVKSKSNYASFNTCRNSFP